MAWGYQDSKGVTGAWVDLFVTCADVALLLLLLPLLFQVNQLLEVGDRNAGMQKYTAMDKWANQLKNIHTSVCNKVL